MVNPLPYMTPYRTPDFQGLTNTIMQMRQMKMRQQMFDAEQAQQAQFHQDNLLQQEATRQQQDEHFRSAQKAAVQAAQAAAAQKGMDNAAEVLKDYSKAAATGD